MAKPKSPLLSLGARGTIGNTLTYQKRHQHTIVRQKPTPKDPYSLAQAYQRWDYQDYAYLWTLESEASKQTYRTRASRYHITGYSLFMREHLKDLPDLAGRWHLDEEGGVFVADSSRNNNTGIIYGAQLAIDGRIDTCLNFDGNNDYVDLGTDPSLDITGDQITYMAWVYHTFTPGSHPYADIIEKRPDGGNFVRFQQNREYILFNLYLLGGGEAGPLLLPNRWYHVACTYDGIAMRVYLNGDLQAPTFPNSGNIGASPAHSLTLSSNAYNEYWKGRIDHVSVRDRCLDSIEVKRHSQRGYPV